MKTLQLNIEDHLYDTLLAMLKGLPKQDIEIIESTSKELIEKQPDKNKLAHVMASIAERGTAFNNIKDPLSWQQEIRQDLSLFGRK